MKPINAYYKKEVIEQCMRLYLEAEAIENGELWTMFHIDPGEDVIAIHQKEWDEFASKYPEFKMKPYEYQ